MLEFEIILVKSSLENGLIFLYQYANDSQVIAGGTELVPHLIRQGACKPYLVDFSEIRSLSGIIRKNNFIRIGTLTTLREVLENPLIKKEFPLVGQALKNLRNRHVLNRATIGGSVSTSSPQSDVISALVALDAKVAVISKTSRRKIELREMIVGHNKNILQPFEMVGYVELEVFPHPHKNHFLRMGSWESPLRKQLNLAINLQMGSDGTTVDQARIAPGNMFVRPKRLAIVEDFLKGKKFTPDLVFDCAELSKKAVLQIFHPLDSIENRKKMLSGALVNGLYEAFEGEITYAN